MLRRRFTSQAGPARLPVASVVESDSSETLDWLARSTGPGVIWAHNFESDSELTTFRFETGSQIARIDDGVAGGGYLRITRPVGEGGTDGQWWRPLSPLTGATNGIGVDDAAASGTMTRKAWPGSVGPPYWVGDGLFNHPQYDVSQTDANEFFIQVRVRMSASRLDGNSPPGKLIYIDYGSGTDQELVIQAVPGGKYRMYTAFGSVPPSHLSEPQGDLEAGSVIQPGGAFAATCTYPNLTTCYEYPADTWVTLLIHIIPGRDWNEAGGTFAAALADPTIANNGIEVWIHEPGDDDYTLIWSKRDYVLRFDTDPGWGLIKFADYSNGEAPGSAGEWTHDYRQVICSRTMIPPPLEDAPQWFLDAEEGEWTSVASGAGQHISDVQPSGDWGEPDNIIDAFVGACVNQDDGEFLTGANGGHSARFGNELYGLKLRAATPAWERLTEPSTGSADETTNGTAHYPDGAPVASHTYSRPIFANGRRWNVGVEGMANERYSSAKNSWERATKQWRYHGLAIPDGATTFHDSQFKWQQGPSAFDPITNLIWSAPQYCNNDAESVVSVDTSRNRGANVDLLAVNLGPGYSFGDGCSVIIPEDRLWVIMCLDGNIEVMDLDNPAGGFSTVASGFSAFNRHGAFYHAPSRSIYCGNGGPNFRKINVDTWSHSAITPGGLTPPAGAVGGAYGHWNFVQNMGNGQGAIVFIGAVDGPTYVLKFPLAGM